MTELGTLARALGTARSGNPVAVAPVRAIIHEDETIAQTEACATRLQAMVEQMVTVARLAVNHTSGLVPANQNFELPVKLRPSTVENFISNPDFGQFYYVQVKENVDARPRK